MDKDNDHDEDSNHDGSRVHHGLNTRYILYIIFAVLVIIGISLLIGFRPFSRENPAVYTPEETTKYIENPDELMQLYNSKVAGLPFFVRWMIGNERVDFAFTRDDGSLVNLAFTTKRGYMTGINKTAMQDPTLSITMGEDTLEILYESTDPVDDLEQSLDEDGMTYDTHRIRTWMKGVLFSIMINLLSVVA